MKLEKRDRVYLGAILLLTVATFAHAFHADYVNWDDNVLIKENGLLTAPFFEAVKSYFGHFYFSDYMPLTLLTFWLDVQLFGVSPVAQHLISVGIHLVNIVLVFLLLRRLIGSGTLTWMITWVFAVHPVQVEPVMWVTSRNGLLSTMFTFLSVIFWDKGCVEKDHEKKWKILAAVIYVLAVLSKSVALLVPALFVYLSLFRGEKRSRVLKQTLPLWVFAIIFIVIRTIAYTTGVLQFQEATLDFERLLLLPLTVLNGLALYFKMIIFPAGLSIIYPRFAPEAITVLRAVILILVSYVVGRFWPKERRRDLYFFTFFTLLFLLPVLQILPRVNYINDRYLYLPLIGMAGLILEFALKKIPPRILWMPLAILPVLSYAQSRIWVNDLAMWLDTQAKNPTNALANNNLGVAYHLRGDLKDAVEYYKRTIEYGRVEGTAQLAYNNLGVILSDKSSGPLYKPDEALKILNEGTHVVLKDHDAFNMRYNIGLIYIDKKDYPTALKIYEDLDRDIRAFSVTDQRYIEMLQKTDLLVDQIRAEINSRAGNAK